MKKSTVEKIERFTIREFVQILRDPRSLLIWNHTNDSINIGRWCVTRRADRWVVPIGTTHERLFSKRIHAVAFAILWQRNLIDQAIDLHRDDSALEWLQSEVDLLQQRMKKALATKNYSRFELYRDKYSNALTKKKYVSSQLEKTLNIAKYIKLG